MTPRRISFVRRLPAGGVIPFLIDDSNRIVSFQLVSGQVRITTVTRNLQALLNAGKAHYWKIDRLSFRTEFDDWKHQVDRIKKFSFRLSYPNPNWTGRDNLEGLMDGLRASVISLSARAGADDSIKTDSDWFQQVMDHVRRGYGKVEMVGTELETGDESRFIFTEEGGSVPAVDRIETTSEELEATPQDMREVQSKLLERDADSSLTLVPDEEDEESDG